MKPQCEWCWQTFANANECQHHMRTCRVVRDIIIEEKLELQDRDAVWWEDADVVFELPLDSLALRYRYPFFEMLGGYRMAVAIHPGSAITTFVQELGDSN